MKPMSRLYVIVAAPLLLLVAPCCSAQYDYSVTGWAAFSPQGVIGSKVSTRGRQGFLNGFDGELPLTGQYPCYVSIYKTASVDGWNGVSGFYWADYRPPLSLTRRSVVEDVYAWVDMAAWQYGFTVVIGPSALEPGVRYRLTLLSVPHGVAYTGPTEWYDNAAISLPYYATDNGLTGYHFRVELSVPEPSSLLALLAGVAGLGGLTLRRRR